MIVGREVGGGVTLFFWQRLLSGTTNKKQITKYFLSHKHVQYGPRGVNVSQSELYLFRLGHQVICVFAMCENRTYMFLPNACFHRIAQ